MVGDGQATMTDQILKPNIVKVRRINDNVLGGFAGERGPQEFFFNVFMSRD